jgi:hypothetical protein
MRLYATLAMTIRLHPIDPVTIFVEGEEMRTKISARFRPGHSSTEAATPGPL